MLREGVLIFRDCCGQSSWLGIQKLADSVKDFNAQMHNSGAAIKTAMSVRLSVCLYTLYKTTTSSNDYTALDPTKCKINPKKFVPYVPFAGFFN
jgi:hypothetical protein